MVNSTIGHARGGSVNKDGDITLNSRDLCYWLMGFFEIADVENMGLTSKQVDIIKRHLALVFKHEIDPSFGDEKHLQELDKVHQGTISIDTTSPKPINIDTTFPKYDPNRKLMC